MLLTDDEIDAIAKWQPIHEEYGRENSQTAIRVKLIVERINSYADIGCELLEDDGLSNYFVLFAFTRVDVPSNALSRKVEGLLIYLSACGLIGVIGRSQKSVGPGFSSHDPLQIEALTSLLQPIGRIEGVVIEAIQFCGYKLLSAEEVSRPLPLGVTPFEYCFSSEPWDRVFHTLFGNTD